MYPDENVPYDYSYQQPSQNAAPWPVGVLERPQTPTEQVAQPPHYSTYPTGPLLPPAAPRKRRPTGAIILLSLVLALIFGVGLFAGWEFAGNGKSTSTTSSIVQNQTTTSSSSNTIEAQQEAAIAKVEPSVVELIVTTAQGQQSGSGVIIDAKGDIITNNHVVNGAQSIQVVLSNGSTENAKLVGTVAADDLAVVNIAPFSHMVVAQIGDSSKLSVGQEVLAIGNPLGITQTATNGIVSALNRSVTETNGPTIPNAIQTDAPINPGNSGGALINLQGQLIGIPTLGAVNTESNTPAQGVGFAIPTSLVQTALAQIIK